MDIAKVDHAINAANNSGWKRRSFGTEWKRREEPVLEDKMYLIYGRYYRMSLEEDVAVMLLKS